MSTFASTATAETHEDVVDPEVPERFSIRDQATASWLVRKVNEARQYRDRVKIWAAAEIRRAEREEQFFISRWGAELEGWARQQIAGQHRSKSLRLPAGTVGFRSEPPKVTLLDEPAVIAWCEKHLRVALRVQTTVLKSEILSHLKQTGEQPPGAEVDPGGQQRFYIK
jgi:hypothetical protein